MLSNKKSVFFVTVFYALIFSLYRDASVTTINVISGILAFTLGMGLVIAAAMANDSGRGGFFVLLFQFMGIMYPLVYIAGLISSISVLYSDMVSREEIATWLSLVSLIWLAFIALMYLLAITKEDVEKYHEDRRRKDEIDKQRKPYLVNLPHCGLEIPEEYKDDYFLSEEKLNDNIYQYADLYTEELFDPLYERFGGVKNNYSRLFFDPERFFGDDQEKMSKLGLGWFYEKAILENVLLRNTNNKSKIAQYYIDYHKKLTEKVQEKVERYGNCTIIDCHSFSNERYWFHDKDIELPDICIGYDEEHVDMELVELIKEMFEDYVIKINEPYSGSLVPTEHYRKSENVKSVMLEINKRLYLNGDNVTKNYKFSDLVFKLDMLMTYLIHKENYKVKEYDSKERAKDWE